MNDLVSIVIPFHNGEEFFEEAIASVRSQTHGRWEVLLVDDGSTDSSSDRAMALARQWPEAFTYLEHPGHAKRGAAASRNAGMRASRGEFIAFLDIDDIWLPPKLEKQLAVLSANPDVDLVYGPLHFWYGWTGRSADIDQDFTASVFAPSDTLIEPPLALLRQIETSNGLPGTCSFLMRRAVFEGGIAHEEEFGMYEDEIFFSKIALRHRMYFMRESLDRYRQHGNSVCARAILSGEYVPGKPNPARRKYLEWLSRYVAADSHESVLRNAIDKQLSAYLT